MGARPRKTPRRKTSGSRRRQRLQALLRRSGWAGYAVAVENAHDRVLAEADFVCPPVNEEGVAQVIEAYLAL